MEKTLDQLFSELKKLPDWDRFPYPEVFYTHFGVKKPQAASVVECSNYMPPPSASVGKLEMRPPAEGGVRQIENLPPLPVEVKVVKDEEESLPVIEDYIPQAKIHKLNDLKDGKVITQNDDDKKQDSDQTK
jgi:hypothetical protein